MKLTVIYTGGAQHTFGGVTHYKVDYNAKGKECLVVEKRKVIEKGIVEETTTELETEYLSGLVVKDVDTVLMHRFKKNVCIDIDIDAMVQPKRYTVDIETCMPEIRNFTFDTGVQKQRMDSFFSKTNMRDILRGNTN